MPTVLIATDDRALNQILETALAAGKYDIVAVRDGATALRNASAEPIDLVLTDVGLPRIDGFELLERLRSFDGPSSAAPVVLMCAGSLSSSEQARADELGAAAVLEKPVRLDVLLNTVRDQLKQPSSAEETQPIVPAPEEASAAPTAAEVPASSATLAAAPSSGAVERDRPIAGTLDELSFPQLLHHLHGMRATGSLIMQNGKKKKAIQVRDGYAVAVKSNLVSECFGNYLVRIGRLTDEQLAESMRRLDDVGGMQGQILVAMDLLSEEELTEALHEQALDKLYEIFEWRNGSFKFKIGARLQKANMLSVEESPANLILTGARERLSIEEVDAFLRENAERSVGRAKSPFYRFQDIDLGPAEEKLLERVDGVHCVRDLTADDPVSRRSLYALLVTGLLDVDGGARPVGRAARPATSSPAPAAAAEVAEADGDLRRELAAMAEDLKGRTYFEMLGVDDAATPEAVTEAYEGLARRTHPDRFHNAGHAIGQLADEVHGRLSQAHEVLSDVKRRAEYVLELRRGARQAAEQAESRIALEAETQFQRGEALLRQRDYQDALAAFGKALEILPEEGEYHAHYGWALHLCHPDNTVIVEEAIEHVQRGTKLARDREKPYLYLGRLYKIVGRSQAAEKMFTRALQIRPECVEAMRELRLINLRREKSLGLIGRFMRKVKS